VSQVSLVALKSFRYGGRVLASGDAFTAWRQDARLFVGLKKARYADAAAKAAAAPIVQTRELIVEPTPTPVEPAVETPDPSPTPVVEVPTLEAEPEAEQESRGTLHEPPSVDRPDRPAPRAPRARTTRASSSRSRTYNRRDVPSDPPTGEA
jgi:hypothetical protein